MTKFAANLSFMFCEVPFLDRFERAAAAGFKGVEYLFPYAYEPRELVSRLSSSGLTQVLFNAVPGDWERGDRGLAALVGRQDEFRASVDRALHYAETTGARQVHVMAGLASSDDEAARRTYLSNLEYAAKQFAVHGLTLLIEPINARDMPGYFLSNFEVAAQVLQALDADNVRLQFDIYHRQIIAGDVTIALEEYFDRIGHIQIAGVPDRHEPDSGELSLPHILSVLETLAYEGWIGCEYRPRAATEDGLGWLRRLGARDAA